MVAMSITYAKEYKLNPKNFIGCYKKFKSVQMAASSIVAAYKEQGIYKECQESGKDFTEYSLKHFEGQEAKVFSEFLLIIYSIINNE